MGFLRNLFRGKATAVAPAEHPVTAPVEDTISPVAAPRAVEKSETTAGPDTDSGVNIWDFNDPNAGDAATPDMPAPGQPSTDMPAVETAAEPAKAPTAPAAKPSRGRRNKTRIIGFESSNSDVVSLFDAGAPAIPAAKPAIVPTDTAAKAASDGLPRGWFVVTKGTHRGTCYTLTEDRCSLGRDSDQSVTLKQGDKGIASKNHAIVTFAKGRFTVEAGPDQTVMLNDAEISGSADLASGDTVRIGATDLRFVALCGDTFGWADAQAKEKSNAATA